MSAITKPTNGKAPALPNASLEHYKKIFSPEEYKLLVKIASTPIKGVGETMQKPTLMEALAVHNVAYKLNLQPSLEIIILGGFPYITIEGYQKIVNNSPRVYQIFVNPPELLNENPEKQFKDKFGNVLAHYEEWECTIDLYIAPPNTTPREHMKFLKETFDMSYYECLESMKVSVSAECNSNMIQMSTIKPFVKDMAIKRAYAKVVKTYLGLPIPKSEYEVFNDNSEPKNIGESIIKQMPETNKTIDEIYQIADQLNMKKGQVKALIQSENPETVRDNLKKNLEASQKSKEEIEEEIETEELQYSNNSSTIEETPSDTNQPEELEITKTDNPKQKDPPDINHELVLKQFRGLWNSLDEAGQKVVGDMLRADFGTANWDEDISTTALNDFIKENKKEILELIPSKDDDGVDLFNGNGKGE